MGLFDFVTKKKLVGLVGGKAFNELSVQQGKDPIPIIDDYFVAVVTTQQGTLPILLTAQWIEKDHTVQMKNMKGTYWFDQLGNRLDIWSSPDVPENVVQSFLEASSGIKQ